MRGFRTRLHLRQRVSLRGRKCPRTREVKQKHVILPQVVKERLTWQGSRTQLLNKLMMRVTLPYACRRRTPERECTTVFRCTGQLLHSPFEFCRMNQSQPVPGMCCE